MPTYEYTCEACGKNWEVEQRISEPKLTDCPSCGQPKAKRLISGGNFMLKGGGWYADGYGNKPSASKSGENKGDSKPSDSKPSDSKPSETKSDSSSSSTPAASTPASTPASTSTSSSSKD
jgi:putative FmdB family regulatory protein